MPIGMSKYHPLGGFYGRSFVEILLPLNRAMERMAQNLAQNVEDLDLFGRHLHALNAGFRIRLSAPLGNQGAESGRPLGIFQRQVLCLARIGAQVENPRLLAAVHRDVLLVRRAHSAQQPSLQVQKRQARRLVPRGVSLH